jgi:hypothetical protein
MDDDNDYEINKIVDHVFKDGILILKVRYQGETMGEHILEVPFAVLKKDVSLELEKNKSEMSITTNGLKKIFRHMHGVSDVYTDLIILVVPFA